MSLRLGFSRMLKCPIREQKLTRLYRAAIPGVALGHSSCRDTNLEERILDNIARGNVCISRECFRHEKPTPVSLLSHVYTHTHVSRNVVYSENASLQLPTVTKLF